MFISLAHLRLSFPNHKLWSNTKLKSSINYIAKESFIKSLENNKFAYSYNASGFELPLISYVL